MINDMPPSDVFLILIKTQRSASENNALTFALSVESEGAAAPLSLFKKKSVFYRHKLQIFATRAQCKPFIVIQFSAAKFRPLTLKSMLC